MQDRGLYFASEKNRDKILKRAQWMQQSRTRVFQPEKDTGDWFSKLRSTYKNSGTFKEKNSPKKVQAKLKSWKIRTEQDS